MKKNYTKTINDFLDLQIKNSNKNFHNLMFLKNMILSESKPSLKSIKNGLEIIFSTDLREEIISIKTPYLRIYGALDTLVPIKIVKILDKKWPNTNSLTIKKAAHIPFFSHKQDFCSILLNFENYL